MKSSRKVHFLMTQKMNEDEKYTLKTKTKNKLTLPFSNTDVQKRRYHVREAIKRAMILHRNL